MIVNIHEAKTYLTKLVESAMKGEEIIITKAGKPVVRLIPIIEVTRRFGVLKEKIKIARDFDAPLSNEGFTDCED